MTATIHCPRGYKKSICRSKWKKSVRWADTGIPALLDNNTIVPPLFNAVVSNLEGTGQSFSDNPSIFILQNAATTRNVHTWEQSRLALRIHFTYITCLYLLTQPSQYVSTHRWESLICTTVHPKCITLRIVSPRDTRETSVQSALVSDGNRSDRSRSRTTWAIASKSLTLTPIYVL